MHPKYINVLKNIFSDKEPNWLYQATVPERPSYVTAPIMRQWKYSIPFTFVEDAIAFVIVFIGLFLLVIFILL